MIDSNIPLVVAIVLGALLLLVLGLLLGHAAWQVARDGRRAQPLAAARHAVVEAIDGRSPPEAAVAALEAVPKASRISVLAELAPTLRGLQRERLRSIASSSGVLDAGERWVTARHWSDRLRAARLYTLLGGGVGSVEVLLDDSHWEVRAEAAEWAADHPSEAVVERLLAMLDDPQKLPRFAAKDALTRIGTDAAGWVNRLLAETSGRQAAAALEVAARVVEPDMLPAGLRLSGDPLPETRTRAAVLLGALGGKTAAEALTALLDDPAPETRAAAALALGRLGHWPVASALAERLRDPDWEVRRSAALALRGLGSPGFLLLRRALGRDDPFAADMARQTLDLPDTADEAAPA